MQAEPYSGSVFFRLLVDEGSQKTTPLSKICRTNSAMMKVGIAIPYLEKI